MGLQKLLNENQIKVRVGTMAPLDVVAAESEVAGREEAVIVAEAALLDAEDDVRRGLAQAGMPEASLAVVAPSLEDVFLEVAGERR